MDGSGRVELTTPQLHPVLPQWSPDGSRIMFSADPTGGVYAIPAEGGSVQNLVPAQQGLGNSDSSWSPDGKKLVFATKLDDPLGELRILDVDSHQITKLPGSDGFWSPRWSPAGDYVMARNPRRSKDPGLKLFWLKTQTWSSLPTGNAEWPLLTRDGKFIYFYGVGGEVGIFRVRVSDGAVEKVIGLKDLETVGWGAGTWIGLDPTDAILFLRDRRTLDIYALTLEKK
jgi:WD40 repeat protein